MTQKSEEAPFTQADASALSKKLSQFGKSLPKGEQMALRAIIERGKPKEEVQGYEQYINWWDRWGDYLYTDIYSNSGIYEGWEDIYPIE